MKKNENGYALLTVLLTVTIFMLIAFTFMGQSANSTKQNERVEANFQSVALAEMGVTYFQHAIQNTYSEVKRDITDKIQEDVKKNIKRDEDYYLKEAYTLFTSEISKISRVSPPIEGSSAASYEIEKVLIPPIDPNDGKINISFSSNGTAKGKSTTLSASMAFELMESKVEDSNGTGIGGNLPTFDKIKKPEGNNVCIDPLEIKNSCNESYINGSRRFDNNPKELNNKLIFLTGGLMFGNANRLTNVKMHAEGSISFYGNVNNVSATLIETKGAASFDSQLELSNSSELLVGGNLSVAGHLTLTNRSFVYVGGSVDFINKHLNIDQTSTMCIRGKLIKHDKINDPYNRLFIYDDNPEAFMKNCGTGSSSLTEMDWGNMTPALHVEYE